MIDWNKLNSILFEKLAYDYVSTKYPEMDWRSTKATRDGNKDGEANYNLPMDITIKYWYEAKYSTSTNKGIPKSHLDSTLVSCLLDGKVAVIAFITNTYISEDYRRRADIFARQRDNLKIMYINGDEIEQWLYDNPEIEFKYFSSNIAECQNFNDCIKKCCFLQNYDLSGNHFTKVKNVECGGDYVLYISFYSTCIQTISINSENKAIELLDSENRRYDKHDELKSNIGFNSFYVPIKINTYSNKAFSFNILCNNGQLNFTADDISIINIYNPKIMYSSQLEIQTRLFQLAYSNDTTNAIFFIEGNAGCGKTYILDTIYHDSKNPFSSYVIKFIGEEKSDTISCYKLIISSLYGDIWEYVNDNKNIIPVSEIEELMIQQINDFRLSNNSVEQVTLYYKNNKKQIEKKVAQNQILVDDFHKLSTRNTLMLEEFFYWFLKQQYNCKIILFSRPKTESFNSYTQKFIIGNILPNDIEATINYNFKNIKCLSKLIKKYPIPLNALHFVNLLCKIHDKEQTMLDKTEFEIQILLNDIYTNLNEITYLSFGSQIMSLYKNNNIVYCVYKIKTGISINALCDYFGEQYYEEIYELCNKRIFKESSDIILPYHDILISAFDSCNFSNLKKQNKVLESFILFAQSHNYVTKSKMFAVLIGIGKQCFWKYRKKASLYRDELHKCAEYNQALEIAKTLNNCNPKNLDDYNLDDCKNQFVMANCIKYTNSYEKANNEFKKIKDIYELTHNPEIYGLFLESETEIVNNYIWMLDVKTAKKQLEILSSIFENLYLRNQIVGHNLIYAFLNYYNRLMFVNYMLDIGSKEDYDNAIRYSREFKSKEYEAFAKMDYAKSLYYSNFEYTPILMEEALKSLIECKEKRRILDAKSELCFINDIMNKTISYNIYSDLKGQIKKNYYIQSDIKIQLKVIMLELLYSNINPDLLRNKLANVSINNSSIISGKRHQAFINHLYAATYYKENNISMSKKYTLKCQKLMKDMGDSYQFIHKNNNTLSEYKGFITINDVYNINNKYNVFLLDIRLW